MYRKFIKRGLDVIISSISILILSLPCVLISIIIKLDSPGPVLFKQERIGIHKTRFWCLKFRTMYTEAPGNVPTHLLSSPDQWITKSGQFLRRSSLDELPQIFNIFLGQMSLVGPRPALWNQDDLVAKRESYGANDIRPGLTGWAQVHGRDELEISEKAKLDGEYARALQKGGFRAFAMDCQCLWLTVIAVLRHDGVVEGGTGELQRQKAVFEGMREVLHK